jgi:hypothetical protein
MQHFERIGLATAQRIIAEGTDRVEIATREKGYGLTLRGAMILRSQREDELVFLTYDAAINYINRHLCPPNYSPAIVVQLQPD